jgi:hypothetical protein
MEIKRSDRRGESLFFYVKSAMIPIFEQAVWLKIPGE